MKKMITVLLMCIFQSAVREIALTKLEQPTVETSKEDYYIEVEREQ